MTLPYDYSRCFDEVAAKCPFACARKQLGHPTYQSYSVYPGGEDCDGFIPEKGGDE